MELVAEGLVNTMALLAITVGLVFSWWWAVALIRVHSRAREAELPEIEAPDAITEKMAAIPPVITIILITTGVAMVGYVIACWLTGVSY